MSANVIQIQPAASLLLPQSHKISRICWALASKPKFRRRVILRKVVPVAGSGQVSGWAAHDELSPGQKNQDPQEDSKTPEAFTRIHGGLSSFHLACGPNRASLAECERNFVLLLFGHLREKWQKDALILGALAFSQIRATRTGRT